MHRSQSYNALIPLSRNLKVHIQPLFTYVKNQHYTVEVDATVTNKDGRLVLKGAKMPFVYQP